MNAVEDVIVTILQHWNEDCKEAEVNQEYFLDIKLRDKKFYLNRKDFYERPIAEITLYTKGELTLMLWRKQLIMPGKVKGQSIVQRDEEYKRSLFKYFLYECIGNFCITTGKLITNRDYAEYDIDNDRLKADSSANGMIITTLQDGTFYEKSQDFDVFMVTDDAYFIYTAHDIAVPNNGIAKIDKEHCMIKEMNKQSIILLGDL